MHILLWIFQVILAAHTLIGAVWKFSHSAAETMPSLSVISASTWQAMALLEITCAMELLLPALSKRLGIIAPISALVIAAEMLTFCGLHIAYGDGTTGPIFYWLTVTMACAFIAYGRFVLKPIK